ncbi:MAG: hypothetical protein AB7I50_20095 [Vicinamibacterales bacterium]
MIDREKVVTVLRRRFPAASTAEVAAAANAIIGLPDEWEDVTTLEPDLLFHLGQRCGDGCVVASEEFEFRLFRKPSC